MIPRGVEIYVALDPIDLRWASIGCAAWSPGDSAVRRGRGNRSADPVLADQRPRPQNPLGVFRGSARSDGSCDSSRGPVNSTGSRAHCVTLHRRLQA
jgi:hypothetical protein